MDYQVKIEDIKNKLWNKDLQVWDWDEPMSTILALAIAERLERGNEIQERIAKYLKVLVTK